MAKPPEKNVTEENQSSSTPEELKTEQEKAASTYTTPLHHLGKDAPEGEEPPKE